jgi:glycosyltransferase involved in cell wall biosynthesis
MTAPLVSIAIRAFRRQWLDQAITSVLTQTHSDLELVIYDDLGELQELTASFADERLRYHRPERHLDAAGRYTAALALCRGRYVGILDDDDRYQPEFVERLVSALEADPGAVAAVSCVLWDHDGRLVEPRNRRGAGVQTDALQAFLELRWTVTPSAILLHRTTLVAAERAQPMPDDVAPDLFVNVRAASAGGQFVLVDAPLVIKRWHRGQASRAGIEAYDRAVATWRQLTVPAGAPNASRLRQLTRAQVRRAARRLAEHDIDGARADLVAARETQAHEWRWRRRVLLTATRAPRIGRGLVKMRDALPHIRRRHDRPPGRALS